MALPYVCKTIKVKAVPSAGGYVVSLGENVLAHFTRLSPAKTWAKRFNSMFRWLGQSDFVDSIGLPNAVTSIMTSAGSGDGTYRPPLNLV
jgi:hypothetical protein